MQEERSSAEGGLPPRRTDWYHIMACLYAFSLEHEPHIMVVTSERPLGATATRVLLMRSTQSAGGMLPRAGRCMSRDRFLGSVSAEIIAGWL